MTKENIIAKSATQHVVDAQKDFSQTLPRDDLQDFTDANRGFIDKLPDGKYQSEDGRTVWDLAPYEFLNQKSVPDSINPSL